MDADMYPGPSTSDGPRPPLLTIAHRGNHGNWAALLDADVKQWLCLEVNDAARATYVVSDAAEATRVPRRSPAMTRSILPDFW